MFEEPPEPQRGRTAEERVGEVAAAEAAVPDTRSTARKVVASANPMFLFSLADGYPVGIKQFLWFCFVLVYPAWLFFLLLLGPIWVVGKVCYGILWVLFWPVRLLVKRSSPEAYATGDREG